MTLEEAANVIVSWLRTQQGIAFLSTVGATEIGPDSFRVQIQQVAPVQKRRVFEVVPTDIPDCYEVKELEAA